MGLRRQLVRLEKENNWCIAGINNSWYENGIIRVSLEKGGNLYRISKLKMTCNSLSSSIDGLKFAFCCSWKGLYIINSDGSGLKELFSAKELFPGCSDIWCTSWSPSGKLIAFTVSYSEGWKKDHPDTIKCIENLYIIDIETGETKFLTTAPCLGISSQAWSPDGNKIVYESAKDESPEKVFFDKPPTHYEIKIMDINTKETIKIAEGRCPSWSPDGRKIAYKDKDGDAYLLNPDGSGKELLIKGEVSWRDSYIRAIGDLWGDLLWSPDSKFILYGRETGMKGHESTLYIIDVETKKSIRIGGYEIVPSPFIIWVQHRRYYFTPSVWVSLKKEG
ncbi:MAG: hypothetical protein AB1422_18920 [bacterium]